MDLIYCGVGNKKLDQIAINCGFKYGMRLPPQNKDRFPFPVYFADQNWKNPNRKEFMERAKKLKPKMCTVLDWEDPEQENDVMSWAEEVSNYCDILLFIPKFSGCIDMIPGQVGEAKVRLAYSVPTGYGETKVSLGEFANRPVHLLGGSPNKQLKLYDQLNVVSVDGNYAAMKAVRFCEFWTGKKGYTRSWVSMKDVLGQKTNDAMYVAFTLSCVNIKRAWLEREGLT